MHIKTNLLFYIHLTKLINQEETTNLNVVKYTDTEIKKVKDKRPSTEKLNQFDRRKEKINW